MSLISTWFICWSLVAASGVEATRLDGQKQAGDLKSLSAKALVLSTTAGEAEIPLNDLQQVQLKAAGMQAPLQIQLIDETLLAGETVTVTAGNLQFQGQELGTLQVPVERVRSVTLAVIEPAQLGAWDEMKSKESQSDLLVIRKGDKLDFVGGTIGSIDKDSVALISRGREAKVPRERVVGVVYATHKMVPGTPLCAIATVQGSQLRVKAISITDNQAQLELTGIPPIRVPLDSLQSLDFALGRIVPLAKAISRQTLPQGVSESVVAIRSYAFSPNSFEKVPLKLGNKTYNDGLLIHPQTKLEFTLNRQFRTLRAVVGIDENAVDRGRFEPQVQVRLLADGKPLWEQTVRWDAAPVNLELDVKDVRTLELITVCEDGKIGPLRHLDLADAKLIK